MPENANPTFSGSVRDMNRFGRAGARRFWIGVASRDHVNVGVKRGFIQLNHGKRAALRRLKAGDGVIMYSPRTAYPDGEPLQAFTAIGAVVTGEVYQVEVTPRATSTVDLSKSNGSRPCHGLHIV